MTTTTVRVGLLGCGSVGSALVGLVTGRADAIEARTGLRLEISRVAVRDGSRHRAGLRPEQLTTDPRAVVDDPDVDVVVELIGGIEPARTLVAAALANRKPVVTGNKALLAAHGAELFAAADAAGVDLLFEAAVAGGIPFIRPLRESLAGEEITRVMGILNGTTNFILTKMTEEGADYDEVLAEAQALGYAEADPSADVDGHDAAAKAAIIASIAYGGRVDIADVHVEGISRVTSADIEQAAKLEHVIKLLGIVERVGRTGGRSGVSVRVHPVMVPVTHPLASVRESFNAVFVEGTAIDEAMFYGRGAGGGPTASAVLGDLIDAADNRLRGTHARLSTDSPAPLVPLSELSAAFYLNLDVVDRPGVLATVAGVLGEHGISIKSLEQIGLGDEARLAFITHTAREADLAACLEALDALEEVDAVNSVLRVLGT